MDCRCVLTREVHTTRPVDMLVHNIHFLYSRRFHRWECILIRSSCSLHHILLRRNNHLRPGRISISSSPYHHMSSHHHSLPDFQKGFAGSIVIGDCLVHQFQCRVCIHTLVLCLCRLDSTCTPIGCIVHRRRVVVFVFLLFVRVCVSFVIVQTVCCLLSVLLEVYDFLVYQ